MPNPRPPSTPDELLASLLEQAPADGDLRAALERRRHERVDVGRAENPSAGGLGLRLFDAPPAALLGTRAQP